MFEKYKLESISDVITFARKNYRLSYLERYNTTPHIHSEKVADHCFQVSIVTLFMYEKFKKQFNLNFERLIKIALIHDEAEAEEYIGDIPHPIKTNNPELSKALENSEYNAIYNLLGPEYKELLEDYNQSLSIESVIVKLADVISCLTYSESEITKGNKYMERVKYESEERMIEILTLLNSSVKSK